MQKTKQQHIWHSMPIEKIAKELNTNLETGLTEHEIETRQNYGANVLLGKKPTSKLNVLLTQFKSPLIYILLAAGLITLFLSEITDSVVIFAAVFVNTIVGFLQEWKATNTLSKLKQILKVKAIVIRNGEEKEILQEELVVGDIIILKAGSKVPADVRIFESFNLKINEAALTGEWLASEKTTEIFKKGITLAERNNMAYMATIAEEGEGKAVVVAIGQKTEIGKIADLVAGTKESPTPYQKKLAHFSKLMGFVIAGVCFFVFMDGVLTGKPVLEMFTTAVAVAVAAIPEGLPVAMTVILALGMQRILKKGGLVRKLSSAETLGSTSIIVTDKTLTLTEGKMKLDRFNTLNEKILFEIASLTNSAFVENPKANINEWNVAGPPTDKALLLAGAEKGFSKPELEKQYKKIDEVIFNSQNKYSAVLLKKDKNKTFLYVVGAPEKLFSMSAFLQTESSRAKLSCSGFQHLGATLEDMASTGLRVLGFAFKEIKSNAQGYKIQDTDLNDLTFVGFLGFKDPLRDEAKEAFGLCRKAGLRPIIATGDHMLTAKAVALELGLKVNKENLMLGEAVDRLTDEQLSDKLNDINVFARVEPIHKMRIVEAWQKKHKVVAMTGDGINDAVALKKADIGVALGSGTDVAKDVSDLVLLNDNFSVLIAAIEEGRAILDNIRKVITYLLSDSFTEIILVGFAVLLKMPLPLLAVQILWVNLIEDGLPGLALAFESKEKDVLFNRPPKAGIKLLTKEMKVIIFTIGFLTDLFLLGIFFWFYKTLGILQIDYIRTLIFTALTIDSLFYVFSCKSLRKNLWQINIFSNKFLVLSWMAGVAALVGAIYLPFLQNFLKTVPLGFNMWLLLGGFGLLKLALIEGVKYYFIVRHQTNA